VTTHDRYRRLVLIGAGSAVFTRGLLADLISAPDLGAWELRLCDVDPDALSVAERLARRMVEARGAEDRVSVRASTNRVELLPDADIVVVSIGVGGRPAWLLDWQIAADEGIFQPVGDSVMPGGISRGLRTIPVMVEIARDVARLAPDARFFNYGNPMTANVAAMRRHSDAEVVGLCHGVMHVQRELARFLRVPFERTSSLYCGLNHLTFIYDLRVDGVDAWPLARERLAEERRAPFDHGAVGQIWQDGSKAAMNPFSWELFERLGAYPAASDRHVTEFFPTRFGRGTYYGKTLGVDAYSLPEILEWGEQRYQTMRREAEGDAPLDQTIFERSSGDQEQLIEIIRSIDGDTRRIFSVNVPNDGEVPALPRGAVLEIPGVATARGLRPMAVPDLPTTIAAILSARLAAVDLLIEAAIEGRRDLVIEALLADGSVTDPGKAARLADRYLDAQARFLPNFS
jgi:alpha-galactosidase